MALITSILDTDLYKLTSKLHSSRSLRHCLISLLFLQCNKPSFNTTHRLACPIDLRTELILVSPKLLLIKWNWQSQVEFALHAIRALSLINLIFNYLLALSDLHAITLSAPEHAWLQSRCPYFTKEYLDYLSSFHFNPEVQIKLSFTPVPGREEGEWGNIEAEIEGLWVETILYEVRGCGCFSFDTCSALRLMRPVG